MVNWLQDGLWVFLVEESWLDVREGFGNLVRSVISKVE